MSNDDIPMISPSNDSTQVELTPQKEVQVNAPEPRRPATGPVPKAPPAEGRTVAPTVNIPPKQDPRNASEARKPGTVAPANNPSASRPAAPAVKAQIPPAGSEDEDPEKLLREYAERQKTKVVRLEQQIAEYKKVVAERDSLRAKVDALGKELQDAKRMLDVAAKSDEVIKDLQGKVDAAILSNSILAEDKEKLKKGLSQQTEFLKKAEERAVQAEKSVTELEDKLVRETQGREEAEAKVAAALEALQSNAAPVKQQPAPRPLSEAATRPMKAIDEKAATPPPKDEKAAPSADAKAASAAKPGTPPQQRPPGRFSFLKK